jgi:hypothetical protein
VIDSPRPFRHNPEVSRAGEGAIRIIDETYRRIALALLDEQGIPVVRAPADTYDDEGFTLPELARPSANDKTHANEAYGARMLERVYDFLLTERAVAEPPALQAAVADPRASRE